MSGGVEVVVFPRIAGVQWSDMVGSALWQGSGRRSCPGYRPAEIALVSCQPLCAARSSPVYGLLYTARWRLVGPAD